MYLIVVIKSANYCPATVVKLKVPLHSNMTAVIMNIKVKCELDFFVLKPADLNNEIAN